MTCSGRGNVIHPDLTNLGALRAMRDEALMRSKEAPEPELKLAFRMLANAAGYLANVIEKEDLKLRLEKSGEHVQELQGIISALQIELTKYMDDDK